MFARRNDDPGEHRVDLEGTRRAAVDARADEPIRPDLVEPVVQDIDGLALRGRSRLTAPVSGNVNGVTSVDEVMSALAGVDEPLEPESLLGDVLASSAGSADAHDERAARNARAS